MKLSVAVVAATAWRAASLEIKQVSFDDVDGAGASLDADARDAKIHEGGPGGSACFVYSSEARRDLGDAYGDDWKIWETCDVFGDDDGPPTATLLAGDLSAGAGTDYKFSDASGDGRAVCFNQDLAGSSGISIHLLTRTSGNMVTTAVTNSNATGRVRDSTYCDLSRDGSALVFESDDHTLLPDAAAPQALNQEHVFFTDDAGASFRRLVPDALAVGTESKWGVLSADGACAAFHSNIQYGAGTDNAASATAWETYLWRAADGALHKVTELRGKECNRTASFERMVDTFGLDALTAENLATEAKLANGQTQCESFAAAGALEGKGAGAVDVKDNAASISDDGRFLTFMAGFESATLRATHEPYAPVSRRNIFLYDAKLGITWGITNEISVDVEAYCCPLASSSYQRDTCNARNVMRQACCWQKPCYNPAVTSRLAGTGDFLVFSTDMAPGDDVSIFMDWDIVVHHVPTGQNVQVTNTDNRDYDDFYPSISRKGDVVAWTSDFDYTTNTSITSTNQIFAAKIATGCSRDAAASNYVAAPDVEACCAWDAVPAAAGATATATLALHGDPAALRARVAFAAGDAAGDAAWCAAYRAQVAEDVACSLAVPPAYVAADAGDCGAWGAEGIAVTVTLKGGDGFPVEQTCSRLAAQYDASTSALWTAYLTKTMKLDRKPVCDITPAWDKSCTDDGSCQRLDQCQDNARCACTRKWCRKKWKDCKAKNAGAWTCRGGKVCVAKMNPRKPGKMKQWGKCKRAAVP